jgi:hypothetical protein
MFADSGPARSKVTTVMAPNSAFANESNRVDAIQGCEGQGGAVLEPMVDPEETDAVLGKGLRTARSSAAGQAPPEFGHVVLGVPSAPTRRSGSRFMSRRRAGPFGQRVGHANCQVVLPPWKSCSTGRETWVRHFERSARGAPPSILMAPLHKPIRKGRSNRSP